MDYTLAELGQWVNLLVKRANQRTTNFAKKDQDLADAQNYLRMMQRSLDNAAQVTLEKFATRILIELESRSGISKLSDEKADDTLGVSWVISDNDAIKGFEGCYTLFVLPAIESLLRALKEFDQVYQLDIEEDKATLGCIQTIAKTNRMLARLTTGYRANTGTVMAIEVGIK